MISDTPLLTLAQVNIWKARLSEIQDLTRAQAEEMVALERKIDAAKVFIDMMPADDVSNEAETMSAPENLTEDSISSTVLAAVTALKGSPKAPAIRNWIGKHHPGVASKLEANPAYLYTSLMRHVRGGRLAKRSKGYRLPPSSPKGETGGVTPPADSFA